MCSFSTKHKTDERNFKQSILSRYKVIKKIGIYPGILKSLHYLSVLQKTAAKYLF